MNVLFVTCWYPTLTNPGLGVFIKEHAKAIATQPGIQLKVLQVWPQKGNSLFRKQIEVYSDENGIETHQIIIFSFAYKFIYLLNKLLNSVAFGYFEQKIAPSWKPDIIHGNVIFQAGAIASYLAGKLNLPFVLSEHWSGLPWYIKTPYVNSKYGISAYKKAKSIFPVSNYLKKTIQREIGGDLKFQVIPNVVDTRMFCFSENKIRSERLELVCITNFSLGRRLFKLPGLILDAMELMSTEERSTFNIHFVGGGLGLEDFKARIETLGINNHVKCLGFIKKREIAELLQRSDGLIHPSLAETFGVVVAEALCCGTPCVVSDVPALNELVSDASGILVSENSAQAWKEALLLFSRTHMEYDRVTIAQSASELFNPERVGSQIVANY